MRYAIIVITIVLFIKIILNFLIRIQICDKTPVLTDVANFVTHGHGQS